ncbi:serine/threonine-protein kinase [Streptomyces sp. NPDC018693]|uniref:serine/threonine-protein kinase n=1 Tax=unclassified Streptomyces TaxID=2593676 RepID=UPI0037B0A3EE
MQPLAPDDPSHIGPYRLLSRLGAGGMGRVYLAQEADGDAGTVAVKMIRTDADPGERDEFQRRFAREVTAARRVSGAWTARVLDADTEAQQPWVATEYVPGPTLRAVVRGDFGPLPSASTHVLAHRLAQALDAIHTVGLVHRDLKPSNILLTVDGPRVIDFGVAHSFDATLDTTLTRTGTLVGTPEFMSPEQVRGERVTPAGDVFSLGSVLVYAATGRSAFRGQGDGGLHALLFRIAYEQPELDAVPEVIRPLVQRCLEKDPEERPSVPELMDLTRRAPAGAWLPGPLLARLDKVAAQPLLNAPRREQDVQAEPERPEFPDVPDALPRRDPLDVPEAGITPPRVLRTAPALGTRVRTALGAATGVLSVAVAGVLLWNLLGSPTLGGDEPVAQEETANLLDDLFGEWEAQVNEYLGQRPFVLHLSAKGDGSSPVFLAATPDAVCRGTFADVSSAPDRATMTRPINQQVILPEGASVGVCPNLGTIRLIGAPPGPVWDYKPGTNTSVRLAGRPGVPIPEPYLGTWKSHGWMVRVDSGTIGDPSVTGTRTSDGRTCTWRAVVLDTNSALRTTPPVLDEPRSDQDCEAPTAPFTLRRT